MKNSKLSIAVAALLSLMTGCAKEQYLQQECGLDVKINHVRSGQMSFTVTPDNEKACYCFTVLNAKDNGFEISDEDFVASRLGEMIRQYEEYQSSDSSVGSFADIFCFRGTRTLTVSDLVNGIQYRLFVFQVDPRNRTALGPLYKFDFSSAPPAANGLTFRIVCWGTGIYIVPSDEKSPWFWEYEMSRRIEELYGTPYKFYHDMIDMFEQFGFMENVVRTGTLFWDFSTDGPVMNESEEYTLVLSGYNNGEITTGILTSRFHYYGENGVGFDEQLSDIPIDYGVPGRI